MKKFLALFVSLALASSIIAQSNSTAPGQLKKAAKGQVIPGSYIVVLRENGDTEKVTKRHGVKANQTYGDAVKGFSGEFSASAVMQMLNDPDVDFIEEDQIVSLDQVSATATRSTTSGTNTLTGQTLPTGVDRVDAEINPAVVSARVGGKGINADIAIIDTGIQSTHPDLTVFKSVSYVTGIKTGEDDNGHGTHVAGIAAAKDNTAGVVGVAPGARLWAVKVLDKSGSGAMSQVISGVDYVTANAASIEVANMSLSASNSDALKLAISKAAAKGVVFVVAAGNNGVDAAGYSPANSPDVLAVSAIVDTDGKGGALGAASSFGADDTLASFSNYGSVVKIAAPGVNIYSTTMGSSYTTLSGTSMASPHVTGAVAIYLSTRTKPTTAAGAAQVRQAIINAATPQTGANGFTGDRDTTPEPLLNAANL